MSSVRARLLIFSAALALTAACTAQGASPTPNDPPTAATGSASALSASQSSSATISSGVPQPTASSGSASPPTSTNDATTSGPGSAESEAALAAYRGFYALISRAYADPSADWSKEVKQWATGPAADQFLAGLAGMAQKGQYASGEVRVEPTVTQVQPGLVDIQSCVDSTDLGLFDKDGQSIKAPNAPGSYFRRPSQAQVGQFEGGAWLVVSFADDFSVSC